MTDAVSYMLKSSTAQMLNVLASLIRKAKAHAEAGGIDEGVLFNARLYPDMLPFSRQVQIACDTVARGAARLARLDMPSFPDTEATMDDLLARLDAAQAYVIGVDDAAINSTEREVLEIPMGPNTVQWEGRQYLSSFILPNLHFHSAIAYALLREQGVKLGKADFLRP